MRGGQGRRGLRKRKRLSLSALQNPNDGKKAMGLRLHIKKKGESGNDETSLTCLLKDHEILNSG